MKFENVGFNSIDSTGEQVQWEQNTILVDVGCPGGRITDETYLGQQMEMAVGYLPLCRDVEFWEDACDAEHGMVERQGTSINFLQMQLDVCNGKLKQIRDMAAPRQWTRTKNK